MHDESVYAKPSLRVGARGYVNKQEVTETLLDAVRRVLNGEKHLSLSISARLDRT